MFQLVHPASAEQIVKKSRFLAMAVPVASEDEAKAAIAAHGDPEASHNCWAWRLGAAYRFSDDGEPSGTAGKPILAAIDGQSVDKVIVIVVRWFGGVLLGSGGLVRAYGGTAEFSDLALVKARLSAFSDLQIIEERFGATGADITARIVETDVEAVSRLVSDLTSGRSVMRVE
jgi:putative IMPACT (imprinted ancient) family translation regulator